MDKLSRLEHMLGTFENWRPLQSYFIGALSTEVEDKVWDSCLKTARECALAYGEKEKQPTPIMDAIKPLAEGLKAAGYKAPEEEQPVNVEVIS